MAAIFGIIGGSIFFISLLAALINMYMGVSSHDFEIQFKRHLICMGGVLIGMASLVVATILFVIQLV